MKILGINQVPYMFAWQHDSAAALVVDGRIVAAAEEERFNRIRHARGYPARAIEYCLREGGIALTDIDTIAISYNPWAFLTTRRVNLYPLNFIKNIANLFLFKYFLGRLARESGANIVYIDHHEAHAASTFYCSGFPRANVLTIDGSGETESFAFFIGEGRKLRRVWDIPFGGLFTRKKWRSIGLVYTRVTNFLGLGVNGEGKTMGLASYGKPRYDFSDILNIENHKKYQIDRRNLERHYGALRRTDPKSSLTQEHKDLAASLQKALEDSVINLAREAYEYSGIKNFALAGGVALNCNTNSKILAQDFCDGIFVQPAATDGGASLGAALQAAARAGENVVSKMEHAYWGPSYSDGAIEKVLKEIRMPCERSHNIAEAAAALIAQGKIVGWFQGRAELGPRALGNRSILANPAILGMDKQVNEEVKHREVWRPFAPSVSEEDAPKYFEGVVKAKESPFMLHTFFVKKEFRKTFPAITHVDGSSRIQTVRKDQNKTYYELLKALQKHTGHPVVLNTSFNDAGEPMVTTPREAIRCFYSTGMDALAIGNFMLKK